MIADGGGVDTQRVQRVDRGAPESRIGKCGSLHLIAGIETHAGAAAGP